MRPPYYCRACDEFSAVRCHHELGPVLVVGSVLLVLFGPAIIAALWICGVVS